MNAAREVANKTCLLSSLIRRKLVENIYPESPQYRDKLTALLKKPTTVYTGFDPTADSLHVGNLATLMNLLHFRRHGHQVICVIGDATIKIGDPSGHHKDRPKFDPNQIDKNVSNIEQTISQIFKNHDIYFTKSKKPRNPPIIVRNSSWYKRANVIDFVGDFFREVRVGTVLSRKAITDRLESPNGMNMSEFSYQVFQAYDWMELRKRYGCNLQIGGSDQAGNIYTGHDFIKKVTGDHNAIGLLAPLIVSQTGKKLGKSASGQGNIWLRSEKTSPYNLYQFFHRVPDADVERYLGVFSLYDDKELEDITTQFLKEESKVWFRQKKLAESVCLLIHGKDGLSSAKRISHAFFNQDPSTIANLSDEELGDLFDESSIIRLVHQDGLRVSDLMRRANCFKNDMDCQRVIEAGGVHLNGARVTSSNVLITPDLIIGNNVTILRVGKRNYFLFKWMDGTDIKYDGFEEPK